MKPKAFPSPVVATTPLATTPTHVLPSPSLEQAVEERDRLSSMGGNSRSETLDDGDDDDEAGEGDGEGAGVDAASTSGGRSSSSGGGVKKKGKKGSGGKKGKHHGKDKRGGEKLKEKPQPPTIASPSGAASATPPGKSTHVKGGGSAADAYALLVARLDDEEPSESVRVCVATLDALGHACALPTRRSSSPRHSHRHHTGRSSSSVGGGSNQAASPPSSSAVSAEPASSDAPLALIETPALDDAHSHPAPLPLHYDPAELWPTLVAWVLQYSHTNLYHGPFFQLLRAGLRLSHEPTLRHVLQSGRLITTFIGHYVDSTPVAPPVPGGATAGFQKLLTAGFGLGDAAPSPDPQPRLKSRMQRRAEASGARGTIMRALNAVRLVSQVCSAMGMHEVGLVNPSHPNTTSFRCLWRRPCLRARSSRST